jgi:hypothetical protein
MKLLVLVRWVVTPCGLGGKYHCFGGSYCLYFQSWNISCTHSCVCSRTQMWAEQNSSCEASSRSASHEFSRQKWNLKVYYRIHYRPPFDKILSPINPVHTFTPNFCLHIQLWKWRQYAPPKRWYLATIPHDVSTQNANIDVRNYCSNWNL